MQRRLFHYFNYFIVALISLFMHRLLSTRIMADFNQTRGNYSSSAKRLTGGLYATMVRDYATSL